jgi:carbamoyltransferase
VQTVGKDANPRFRQLLEAFYAKTGCPVLVNTSFNVRGEPIVESPHNAYLCFMRTEMDYLVLGTYILRKSDQPALLKDANWREHFVLD